MTTPAESDNATVRSRRRWYQLGLRSLLLMVTLIAVALAWTLAYVRPYLRQSDIRDRIRAIGGITTEAQAPGIATWFGGTRVLSVDLSTIQAGLTRRFQEVPGLTSGTHYDPALVYRDGHAARDEDYLALLHDLGELTDLNSLNVSGNDVTDEIVANWRDLRQLRTLNLVGTLVRDATIWPDTWEQLTELDVSRTPMESAGLAAISKYRRLSTLSADETACDDDTISAWQALDNMQLLSIIQTRVTPQSRAVLEGFPQMKSCWFFGTTTVTEYPHSETDKTCFRVSSTWGESIIPLWGDFSVATPQELASEIRAQIKILKGAVLAPGVNMPLGYSVTEIEALPELALDSDGKKVNYLKLDSRYVTDATLAHLNKFPHLRGLDLTDSWITDAGLRHLAQCPHLEELTLRNTRVTNAGLTHLRACRKLTMLDLGGTRITHAALPLLVDLCQSEVRLGWIAVPPAVLRCPELNSLAEIQALPLGPADLLGLTRTHSVNPAINPPLYWPRPQLTIAAPGRWDVESRTSPGLRAAEVRILLALPEDMRVEVQVSPRPYLGHPD